METWLPPLITGALGIFGGWLLGRQSEKRAERQRKVEHAQQYSNRAVQALTKAKLSIQRLQPDSYLIETKSGGSALRVQEAAKEYIENRPALTEVAFGHPDAKLREALTTVDKYAFSVMSGTTLFVLGLSHGDGETESQRDC